MVDSDGDLVAAKAGKIPVGSKLYARREGGESYGEDGDEFHGVGGGVDVGVGVGVRKQKQADYS